MPPKSSQSDSGQHHTQTADDGLQVCSPSLGGWQDPFPRLLVAITRSAGPIEVRFRLLVRRRWSGEWRAQSEPHTPALPSSVTAVQSLGLRKSHWMV
jgi:hypothetical protein